MPRKGKGTHRVARRETAEAEWERISQTPEGRAMLTPLVVEGPWPISRSRTSTAWQTQPAK